MPNDLTALADEIERAEGPSRELDVRIAISVGWDINGGGIAPFVDLATDFGLEWAVKTASEYTSIYSRTLPQYTASIDAALTLAGDFTEVKLWQLWNAALTECSKREAHIVCDLPRFICAAALRAKAGAA